MERERKGSRNYAAKFSRFRTASVRRSQRLPANGNASITIGPIFFSILSRSMARARCNLVFTVSGFNPENLGGFLDVHPLDHTGDEDNAKGVGKVIDRVFDHNLNFTLCHGLFRVGCSRKRKLDDLGLQDSWRQRRPFNTGSLAAQSAQSLIHGDARQPCREA